MIYPSFEQVRTLAHSHSLIPICYSMFADTETPVRLYSRIQHHPYSFLLESVGDQEQRSRYSFIGRAPFLRVTARDGVLEIRDAADSVQKRTTQNPFQELSRLLRRYQAPHYSGYPPFLGGAVGYVGYEAIQYLTPSLFTMKKGNKEADDFHFLFYDRLWVFDHLKQEILIVAGFHVPSSSDDIELHQAYDRVIQEIMQEVRQLQVSLPDLPPLSATSHEGEESLALSLQAQMTPEEYLGLFLQAKEQIQANRVSQVVLSQRWLWEEAPSPFTTYRYLRILNPSPYLFYLSMGEESLVGSSPESLIRIQERKVTTRPIAGTRPRGIDEVEDQRLAAELLQDAKELAEHQMLLQLSQKEIAQVSIPGSVQVVQKMKVERFSHVMHLVSQVTGQLKEMYTPVDAFCAAFPAGTVSGFPKEQAMELIAELEPVQRGAYAGAVGYFSFAESADLCITIRTVYFLRERAFIQAGGGIVADSTPASEYKETELKAQAVIQALILAAQTEKVAVKGGSR